MVEQKKKISINPAFFNITNRGKKTQKQRKQKPSIKPNTIKRELLNKIKSHQKEERDRNKQENANKKKDGGETDEESFEDEFMSSLNYLKDLVNKKKEKKNRRTQSNRVNYQPKLEISENKENNNEEFAKQNNILHNKTIKNEIKDLDNVKIDVPYGILKNGKKPTYRQYMNIDKPTVLMKTPLKIQNNTTQVSKEFEERRKKLQDLKESFKRDVLIKPETINTSTFSLQSTPKSEINMKNNFPKKYKKRRTFKTKRKLGKSGRKIGVLIKNNSTRKKVEEDFKVLQESDMITIKRYLRNHGLIKVGSSAPSEVLRKIYEDSFLTGDVHNKNSSILLHNYLNGENEDI